MGASRCADYPLAHPAEGHSRQMLEWLYLMPIVDSASAAPLSAIRRYFEISLYLLLLISVLTLVSTGKLDLVTILLPPTALLVKGYRWWRSRGPELSHRIATVLVAAYFLFFPVDLWVVSRGLAANAPNPALYGALLATIHLMLFAMIVRLYSATTTRDYLFLAMLAFTVMLAAAILTVDTTFLVFFLIFLVLCVSTFVGLEIRRGTEGAMSPPLETGTPAARRLHRALSLTSSAVALGALVIGAAIFFLIPRFSAGYLSAFNLQPSLMSGFSDNVELGQIGEIKKNTAVVMRVRVEGGPEPAERVRWRGIALTTFDGKRWLTEAHEATVVTPGADGWYVLGAAPPEMRRHAVPLRYAVLLEPMATDALFVAAQADRVRGRFSTDAGPGGTGSRRTYLVMDKTNSLFNPFHNFVTLRYEGFSFVPAVPPGLLRAASAGYPEAIREVYLQLPELDPRIAPFAKQVTSGAKTAYDKAAAIELYLRTHYGYTLELSGAPAAHPLANFLFDRRAGHCEYFAAAMTVMLRALHIPARYVNGFLPGEYNELGEDYIVRASDAHSWVEVYFPEYGWIPFDPTPPGAEKPKGLLGRLALYWDWFELQWNEWVINYDFAHQMTLALSLQRTSRDWTERGRAYFRRIHRKTIEQLKTWQARVADAPYALPVALGILVGLALLLRGRALARRVAILWGMRIAPDSLLTPRLATFHYQQMLRLLARRGFNKQPEQTPREFAASLPATEIGGPVAQLTDLYQMARFGAHSADKQRISQLLASIRRLLRSRR